MRTRCRWKTSNAQWLGSSIDKFRDDNTVSVLDTDLVNTGLQCDVERVVVHDSAENTTREWTTTAWMSLGDWLDKGDPQRLEVRCRMMVQETNVQSTMAAGDIGAVCAATSIIGMLAVDLQSGLRSETQNRSEIHRHFKSTPSPFDHAGGTHSVASGRPGRRKGTSVGG